MPGSQFLHSNSYREPWHRAQPNCAPRIFLRMACFQSPACWSGPCQNIKDPFKSFPKLPKADPMFPSPEPNYPTLHLHTLMDLKQTAHVATPHLLVGGSGKRVAPSGCLPHNPAKSPCLPLGREQGGHCPGLWPLPVSGYP